MLTVQPTAPSYTAEVTVHLGGQPRALRFGLNTLRDYTALTGSPAGQLAADLMADYNLTLLNLVFVAVKRYCPAAELPAGFDINTLADWIDEMSETDAHMLAASIIRSIKVPNPLTTALVAQLTPPTPAPDAQAKAKTAGPKSLPSPTAS